MTPLATGEAYVNFMTEEEGDRIETAYGTSYALPDEPERGADGRIGAGVTCAVK